MPGMAEGGKRGQQVEQKASCSMVVSIFYLEQTIVDGTGREARKICLVHTLPEGSKSERWGLLFEYSLFPYSSK